MISISRRRALVGALALGVSHSGFARQLGAQTQQVDTKTFAAFVDVILPADDLSPSASDLGVDNELLSLSRSIPLFLRLSSLGTAWLNRTGRGPFHGLALTDQQRVVKWMSTADRNEIPGRFFELVRMASVEIYYSRPEALASMDINEAPQPIGYAGPWLR